MSGMKIKTATDQRKVMRKEVRGRFLTRHLCIFLSFVCLLSFSSCSLIERFQGDMSRLTFENGNLLYEGHTFYRADGRLEIVTETENEAVQLGWHSQFPFFPDMYYFAFEEMDPLFIFCQNSPSTRDPVAVYVRSDLDIYRELFTVENTDIEISLSSAMTKSDMETSAIKTEASSSFCLYLKDDPRIRCEVRGAYRYGKHYYVIYSGEAWLLSDTFVAMLTANGILESDKES